MSGLENVVNTGAPFAQGVGLGIQQDRALQQLRQQQAMQLFREQQMGLRQEGMDLQHDKFDFLKEKDAAKAGAEAGMAEGDAQLADSLGMFNQMDPTGAVMDTQGEDTPKMRDAFMASDKEVRKATLASFLQTTRQHQKELGEQTKKDAKSQARMAEVEADESALQMALGGTLRGQDNNPGIRSRMRRIELMKSYGDLPMWRADDIARRQIKEEDASENDPFWEPSEQFVKDQMYLHPGADREVIEAGLRQRHFKNSPQLPITNPQLQKPATARPSDVQYDPEYAAAKTAQARAVKKVADAHAAIIALSKSRRATPDDKVKATDKYTTALEGQDTADKAANEVLRKKGKSVENQYAPDPMGPPASLGADQTQQPAPANPSSIVQDGGVDPQTGKVHLRRADGKSFVFTPQMIREYSAKYPKLTAQQRMEQLLQEQP